MSRQRSTQTGEKKISGQAEVEVGGQVGIVSVQTGVKRGKNSEGPDKGQGRQQTRIVSVHPEVKAGKNRQCPTRGQGRQE